MNRTAQNGPVAGVGTRENAQGPRPQSRLHEARHRRGARARRADEQVGPARAGRSAHHQRLVPRLPPDLFADPQSQRRSAADRVHDATDAARSGRRCSKKHNWRTYYYGNFAPEDGGGRESARIDPANPGNATWRTFDHRPRFGNNYAGLRNRIAILSEAYSYLDFKGRVDVTEHFVEEIYKSVRANAKQIMTLTAQADRALHRAGERQARRARRGLRDPLAAATRSRSSSAT